MQGKEKATFLVYGRGHDPNRLRLGNLAMFPYNPDEDDPYICPYQEPDLEEWIRNSVEPELTITQISANDKRASVTLANLVGGDVGRSKGSTLRVEGKNARRLQISQADAFLNSVILSLPEARKWLSARISLARDKFHLTRLKLGKATYPQIWMVTGLQLLSDATVYSDRTGSAKTNANMQVPTPEVASATLAALGSDGKLAAAELSSSSGGQNKSEYYHTDERVWAAQFRRLKLNFTVKGAEQTETAKDVLLDGLLDLDLAGMKSGSSTLLWDETRHIVGMWEDDDTTEEDEEAMTEEEIRALGTLGPVPDKHALLIGGSEQSLNGVRADLQAMEVLLRRRGFGVSFCYGASATRRGILDAWRALVHRIPERSEDAVVVYYSGHGGASDLAGLSEAGRIQYLLPYDIEQTTEQDFRGILDVELSHLVNCLTDRTHNVTIILDCCHATRMARAPPTSGARAWSAVERKHIDSHVRRLRDAGLYQKVKIEGNRYAVRVMAAESDKLAYEGEALRGDLPSQGASPPSDRTQMGRLTRELVLEFEAAGKGRTSWDMVHPQLRLKLQEPQSRMQRPTIQGPRMRVLFSLDRLDYWGQLRVRVQGDKLTLMGGGALAGVEEGDEYVIMPRNAASPDLASKIGVAKVVDVWPTKAVASLTYCEGHHEVPSGAVAFPFRRRRSAYGVSIQVGDEELTAALETRLGRTGTLHCHHDDVSDRRGLFATIKQHGDKLVLTHEKEPTLEYPLLTSFGALGDAVNDVVFQLEKLVTADQLLKLAPQDREDELDASLVSVEIGLVRERRGTPFPDGAHHVTEGERAYLVLRNQGPSKLYASVFHVSAMGSIEWRSHGYPSGAEILPGNEYAPGQPAHGPAQAQQLVSRRHMQGQLHIWPAAVPRREPLDEAYVIVLTSGKADLGFWENLYRPRDRGSSREGGDDDDDATEYLDDFGFCVKRVDFKLVPKHTDTTKYASS